ncbi:MAG: FMN-binding glutamate synthase family protein, partial [Xanthomonadales bacterium]|nr:FMN-binding glutamate synthase family protein [Xanthomonadales bacterium]
MLKRFVVLAAVAVLVAIALWAYVWRPALWLLLLVGPAAGVLIHDLVQVRHTILRNFPLLGHLRYFFEDFRQHVRQYFIQADDE